MSNAGRPTVITPKVVSQLVALLSVGLTVREACLESGISHEAYYSRARNDDQFADEMANAQNNLTNTAKKVVAHKIMDHDAKTSMWWLERIDKKELARLQAKGGVSSTAQPEEDEQITPTTTEEMIEIYEGYEQLIAHRYEQTLTDKIYELPESERDEAKRKLNELSFRELTELAVADMGGSLWHREK